MFYAISLAIIAISIAIYNYPQTPPDIPDFTHFYHLPLSDTVNIKYFIQNMTNHAISNYFQFAFPSDFLDPQHGNGINWSYGSPSTLLTLYDAIDTLYILNSPYYKMANEAILNHDFHANINTFEFINKVLASCLSMYDATQNQIYLNKAIYIANHLSNHDKMPFRTFDFNTKSHSQLFYMSLSFVGTRQLEMAHLSHLTQNATYLNKALSIYGYILKSDLEHPGLFPSTISNQGELYYHDAYAAGSGLDSFYQYLLKTGIYTNDKSLLNYANISLNAIKSQLTRYYDGYTYIASDVQVNNKLERGILEHTSCQFASIFALHQDLQYAIELADGCWHLYQSSHTKLGPSESTAFIGLQDKSYFRFESYLVESHFYLYRLTKNQTYQQRNYEIARIVDEKCKTSYGYSPIDVNTGEYLQPDESKWMNWLKIGYYTLNNYLGIFTWDLNAYVFHSMDSQFFKMMKMIYLTFDDGYPLEAYLFNNNGHAIKMSNK
eukprot:NODE_274_length_10990_cov_0.767606.p2 type:complete len:492 gc:universal NODE_274_length_10990_cov_0.767606:2701-1226(-)